MGRVKNQMMEDEERGFYSMEDRYLCSSCIGDPDLGLFVRERGARGECSYCGSKLRKVISFNEMMELLASCISEEYGEPNNVGVAWDGGWCGEVYDSDDLICEIGIPIENMDLQNDIIDSLSIRQWCKRDFYNLSPSQVYLYGWKRFVRLVKHKSRYSFYRAEDVNEFGRYEEIPAQHFMDSLSEIVDSLGLYKTLSADKKILRVRIHDRKVKLTSAKELGAPPVEYSTFANRMSPSGISMFYGAFDRRTAIAETYELTTEDKVATVGTFKPSRALKLVDLSHLPEYQGLFSGIERNDRHQLEFIHDFLQDFIAPVTKDGLEHIEYVPTQIISEHFRFIHLTSDRQKIDGIIYPSSKQKGRDAIVIFCDNDDCVDAMGTEGLLKLERVRRVNPKDYIK